MMKHILLLLPLLLVGSLFFCVQWGGCPSKSFLLPIIRIQHPFLNEAEIHFQCPTLQENQTKYPTNINGEEYPAFVASAAGWEPLFMCAVGGCPAKFPFLAWP